MIAYICDTDLPPYIVRKIMNALVLRIILHVVFEHASLAGNHVKNSHFAQSRIIVNRRALPGSRARKQHMRKLASGPLAAFEVR
jgi:hypothetical protein